MKTLKVKKPVITLAGGVPKPFIDRLIQVIRSVPENIFFDKQGKRRTDQISEFDKKIGEGLKKLGWGAEPFKPFSENGDEGQRFEIDFACKHQKLLVEIEKGQLPRLELDIIKMVSACKRFPLEYRFGALIVPSTYIELKLSIGNTPYKFLERLRPIVKPIIESFVEGFIVIGYEDPRQR